MTERDTSAGGGSDKYLGSVLWGFSVLAAIIIPLLIFVSGRLFRPGKVIARLEGFSLCRVKVKAFHRTFFPHPGYIAEGLVFTRDSQGGRVQLASVRTIECRASWLALLTLTRRIEEVRLDGLKVSLPAQIPPARRLPPDDPKTEVTVSRVIANGAILEVQSKSAAAPPLRFDFHSLFLGNVAAKNSMEIRTVLHNPEPSGDLTVKGRFGPLVRGRIAETPLSGSFVLAPADLSGFHVIAGSLSSAGSFRGILRNLAVEGEAKASKFEVTSNHHAVDLSTNFHAVVDGQHGNVIIDTAEAHFLHTTINARGDISGKPEQEGKTVSLRLQATQARIEDLLPLFIKSDRSPIYGPMRFETLVLLPPGPPKFLNKVRLNGDFDISEAHFRKAKTQEKVDELSDRARKRNHDTEAGSEAETIASNMKAEAVLLNGIASLSHLSFRVPGAVAQGKGTFSLGTKAIDFQGTVAMESSLSRALGGKRSIFLVPLDPFFKRSHAGAVLPIRVTGTYSHPLFKMSMTAHKE